MTELHTELTALLDGWYAGETTIYQLAEGLLDNRDVIKEALACRDALVAALQQIIERNQERHWTATRDNPETHWEVRDGPFAKIARQALARRETT